VKQFLLVLLIITTAPLASAEERQESKLFRDLGKAVYISQVADIISTEISLSKGNVELNPAMKNRLVRIPAKIAGAVIINKLTARLYEMSPTAAVIVRAGVVSAATYATTKNLQISYSVSF